MYDQEVSIDVDGGRYILYQDPPTGHQLRPVRVQQPSTNSLLEGAGTSQQTPPEPQTPPAPVAPSLATVSSGFVPSTTGPEGRWRTEGRVWGVSGACLGRRGMEGRPEFGLLAQGVELHHLQASIQDHGAIGPGHPRQGGKAGQGRGEDGRFPCKSVDPSNRRNGRRK